MKLVNIIFVTITVLLFTTVSSNAQTSVSASKTQKPPVIKIEMHRYIVERSFPNKLEVPLNDQGANAMQNVTLTNSEENVTWIQSYVTEDKKKTFCVYDAPSKEAIRKAAKENNLPVDKITEVKVLDPYFYK